ncbi:uncharacterized protein CC84DRAFT_1193758 [Paraphaeosphaeria sporulosa]|uniref:TPR domain protein n=1 Tax=Paraphaeosphaeria sporulosa TaxID=1460663 RepID=A0A177CTX8_9PLEO|nr:uncharacterized protein CC84DRAFT_1193758 [Paraphaeosphaeria sporulosa]OAG10237.1 hypothetical protein CC84DRAFT_1193758 [Paraphaeosphaeria sporulosa]
MAPKPESYIYNLGSFKRKVSTASPAAQVWFDRGLIWSYGFHHEEADRCFQYALEEDPNFAMAYWGRAFALGPNYNKPWELFDPEELKSSIEQINIANAKAKENADDATDVEQALIDAIQSRVPKSLDDKHFRACNEAYAEAMASVYNAFHDDLDVATLYADALMNLSAWDLWDLKTGEPRPGARTLEAKAILEKALSQEGVNEHPGVLHMFIHLMEMSKTPEAALVAADHLRNLCPEAGHLVHMGSHIDIQIGDYRRAVASNAEACIADEKFFSEQGGDDFYTIYRLHDYHFLAYAAMFAGQYHVAIDAVARLELSLTPELVAKLADWVEAFTSIRVEVLVRFGRWDDLIALQVPRKEDQTLYAVLTAMIHYGRGVAFAATGDVGKASEERELLYAAVDRIPQSRISVTPVNKSHTVMQVAKAMLDGELEYRKGNYDVAFKHLEEAVELEDGLNYAEPWPWMMPSRHAYAALLLEQGRVQEAAIAYAADLGLDDNIIRARQHPNNVWALQGYFECLGKLGRTEEAKIIGQQLQIAQAVADVDVQSSCYCRTSCCGT